MSESQSSPASSQVPNPPSHQEPWSDPAQILALIEARIAAIYSAARAGQPVDKPPALDRGIYLEIHTAIHAYFTATKRTSERDTVLSPKDLYSWLKQEIRRYCLDIRVDIFALRNAVAADGDAVRRLLTAYVAQWNTFVHLAGLVTNLMQFMERNWIRREIDERKKGIYLIRDLHDLIWKEEVLQIEGLHTVTAAKNGSAELVNAVSTLQDQGEGTIESDTELVEDVLKSLSSLGLAIAGQAVTSVGNVDRSSRVESSN